MAVKTVFSQEPSGELGILLWLGLTHTAEFPYSWKDGEEVQGTRQGAGSSTFVQLYFSQRSIDASKRSTEGSVCVALTKQLCFSPLGEPIWATPEMPFQLFDHAWCDLWENSLLCLSSWTSGLCNELGDHTYQIQPCLQSPRFIHLFMHAFNKCLLSPMYAADIPLAIEMVRLDLGHVAVTGSSCWGFSLQRGQERLSRRDAWVRFWRTRAS